MDIINDFRGYAAIELANQAINGIKELAGHVTSVGQMGKQLTQLADAHEELEKDADAGNMEAFWALEDIKKKEYEIKQYSSTPVVRDFGRITKLLSVTAKN